MDFLQTSSETKNGFRNICPCGKRPDFPQAIKMFHQTLHFVGREGIRGQGKANLRELSGTGDSQRDSRESIRANHSQ